MTFYTFAQPADLAQLARRIWYWPVVRGLLAVVFGLLAVFLPDKTPGVLVQVFGAFVIVDGLVSLIDGLRRKGTQAGSVSTGIGVVAIIFGVVMLFLPQVTLTLFLALIAIWALLFGLLQIFGAIALRSRGGGSWVWGLVSGLIFVALAIVCFVRPSDAIEFMSVVVGIFAIAIGVMLVTLGLRMRKLAQQAGPGDDHDVIEGEVIEG
ncbi:HdeD family acid-resistance protein [Isoptericola jiangsuensis]|uniref:HdeD family acid-resistance protein n=1 Tax=Isoptericola jiangsuensis TaxID=548579 RepID=UPI003AAB5CFE